MTAYFGVTRVDLHAAIAQPFSAFPVTYCFGQRKGRASPWKGLKGKGCNNRHKDVAKYGFAEQSIKWKIVSSFSNFLGIIEKDDDTFFKSCFIFSFIAINPPLLRGFVCTYHLAALGSNPKHTIYLCIFQFKLLKLKLYLLEWEKDENKRKRGRDWPIF